jgi:hypothetical protein
MTDKCEWPWPDVAYALAKGMGRPANIEREGFGRRLAPPGSPFWQRWKANKEAMKTAGYSLRDAASAAGTG